MADFNNKVKTTVELDATQAQQEVVKLNAKASDSTKDLTERIEAKNKQSKIEEALIKSNIANLEKAIKKRKQEGADIKVVDRLQAKLNKERVKATKLVENNAKQQNKLSAAYKKSKSSTENLDKATGGLLTKFKLLATNPIGLIIIALVGAFTLLKKALGSSEEGQNKLAKASAVLGSIFDNIIDIVSKLANKLFDMFTDPQKAIKEIGDKIKENIQNRLDGLLELIPALAKAVKLLFEGEFAEAATTAGDAVAKITLGVDNLSESIRNAGQALSDFAKEVARDAAIAANIADKRANADKLERDLIVARATAERDIAAFRDKASRKDLFSLSERRAALQSALDVSENIINKEIEAAKLRASAIIEENTLANSNKEALQAEEEAKAKLIQLETKKLDLQKRLGTELSALNLQAAKEAQAKIDKETADKATKDAKDKADKETAAAEKEDERIRDIEAQFEIDALDLERRRNLGENILADELAFLERQRIQALDNKELTDNEWLLINKDFEKAKRDARKEDLDNSKTAAKAKKKVDDEFTKSTIENAAEAFGISQELKIAEMIMAAPAAVGSSFEQAAKTYAPPLSLAMGALGAAGVIVPIIKGLADIKKTRFPGKSKKGSSSSSSSISSVATTATAPQSITPDVVENIAANNSARLGVDTGLGNGASAAAASNISGSASPSVVFSEGQYGDFQNQVAFKEDKITV